MALKSTIFKADLHIADMDRNYYGQHSVVIARHPSETDERMMLRLLAFVVHADEALAFGKGISTDDEPDLWRKDLTGAIDLWIDVGRPDERRVRKACGRAAQVIVYTYGGSAAAIWWDQVRGRLERAGNLTVRNVPLAASQALAKLAQRTMQLHCTVHDGLVSFADDEARVEIAIENVKPA
jgi:uncharacterized protein YaeQ